MNLNVPPQKSERYINHMKKKSSTKPVGIKLGDLVKDLVTGFTGIATSHTEYLYGCVHIGITSRGLDKDGIPVGAMNCKRPAECLGQGH